MANLLYWLGPDRIIYGTDFPIWYPHWQLDDFMAFELPEDLKQEYGVDLTPEIKQKIIGGNIARLYEIDIEAKLEQIKDDELSQRRSEYLAGQPAVEVPTPPDDAGGRHRRRRDRVAVTVVDSTQVRRVGRRRSRTRRCGPRSPSSACWTRSRSTAGGSPSTST